MSWDLPVYSSHVTAVGYDDEAKEMLVTFKNGKRVAYAGVPESLALELSKTTSVGSMLNSDIKGHYPFRYI